MSVVCCKCGNAGVSCEAMINPNTKEFIHYTDESFDYGWCDDCKKGQALTDAEVVKQGMEEAFNDYFAIHMEDPLFALCEIVFTSTGELVQDMLFKLTPEVSDEDDEIFFYSEGMEGLKSMTEYGVNDFIITGINEFL